MSQFLFILLFSFALTSFASCRLKKPLDDHSHLNNQFQTISEKLQNHPIIAQTVRLEFYAGSKIYTSTGTIVDNQTIMTAAHSFLALDEAPTDFIIPGTNQKLADLRVPDESGRLKPAHTATQVTFRVTDYRDNILYESEIDRNIIDSSLGQNKDVQLIGTQPIRQSLEEIKIGRFINDIVFIRIDPNKFYFPGEITQFEFEEFPSLMSKDVYSLGYKFDEPLVGHKIKGAEFRLVGDVRSDNVRFARYIPREESRVLRSGNSGGAIFYIDKGGKAKIVGLNTAKPLLTGTSSAHEIYLAFQGKRLLTLMENLGFRMTGFIYDCLRP